jgi:hypothetical protein
VAGSEGEEAFKLIRQWGLALVRQGGARDLLVAVVGFGCWGCDFCCCWTGLSQSALALLGTRDVLRGST